MLIDDVITTDILTGKRIDHLVAFNQHRLHPFAFTAFRAMQNKAANDGINLQPASTFRDFNRQKTLWNEKFHGQRAVLNIHSQPIDIEQLDIEQRCLAILRWSALPGASRHHWGTDLDVYDPDQLPDQQKLRLEPWEYNDNGYFARLTAWLNDNMDDFEFYRPYNSDHGGVAYEPWHLSYRPQADKMCRQLTVERLLDAWQGEHIAGKCWLEPNLTMLFSKFIV